MQMLHEMTLALSNIRAACAPDYRQHLETLRTQMKGSTGNVLLCLGCGILQMALL